MSEPIASSSSSSSSDDSQDQELPLPTQKTFKRNAHIAYFLRCLRALPSQAQEHDSNRITIAYFCISGLDILNALEERTTKEERKGWIEWIWALQAPTGGFRGSPFMDTPGNNASPGHIPSTYTAVLTLAILRAPLDKLDVTALSSFLEGCQAADGSFSPLPPAFMESGGFQNDVRMTYCASVISSMVQRWDFDVVKAGQFVEACRTWEGGYASRPGVIESQGGTTYCSLASLSLLPAQTTIEPSPNLNAHIPLPKPSAASDPTLRWLLQRQIGGFQGRPGKLEDVCYSFWIGGAIALLGHPTLINSPPNRSFLLSSQSPLGGFSKEPGEYPDPFHSYLALAALSLSSSSPTTTGSSEPSQEQHVIDSSPSAQDTPREEIARKPDFKSETEIGIELGLKPLDVAWNVGVDTAEWLKGEIIRIRG